MPVSLIASVTAISPDDGTRTDITSRELNTTDGTLIVVFVACYAFSGGQTITDSKGNLYTSLDQADAINAPRATGIRSFYRIDPVVGTHHSFNCQNTLGNGDNLMMVLVFGGKRFALDKQHVGFVLSGSSVNPGPLTPVETEELFVTGAASGDFGISLSVSGGYSEQFTIPFDDGTHGHVNYGGAVAWKQQAGALATEDPTWDCSPDTNVPASIVAFKAAPLPTRKSYGYSGSLALSS